MTEAADREPEPTGGDVPSSDAPPPTAKTETAQPIPWPVTLGITFAFGALSGVVLTYALGIVPIAEFHTAPAAPPRVTIAAPDPATGSDSIANPSDGTSIPESVRSLEAEINPPAPAETNVSAEDQAETFSETIPTDQIATLLGPAVFSLIAEDDEGDPLPPAPAPMLSDGRALIPIASIRGAVKAVLVGHLGERLAVTGVVAQDTTLGVALLELAAPPTDRAFLDLRATPLSGPTLARLIVGDTRATEHEITPGAIEPQSRAPRLHLSPPAGHAGVLVDASGALVGIVPASGAFAIDTHLARGWAGRTGAVALDVFQRTVGPGSGKDRLQRARKLLAQQRFDEATREFLGLTAEDPSLLPDVRAELKQACQEAVRPLLASGQWQSTTPLLTEVLSRVPEASGLWASLGRSHAMAGNLRMAIEAFLAAADHEPAERSVHIAEAAGLLLEEAAALDARGRAAEAVNLLTDLRSSFPQNGEIRVTLGELLMRMRRFREAANLFFEAATADPRVASSARRRGEHARDLAGGPGAIAIDYPVGQRDITILVRIEGATMATLLLDDDEDMVVLPPSVAARAGHKVLAAPRIRYHDDPSAADVPTLTLGTLSVLGVPVQGVQAVLLDGYGGSGAVGVLGRSFLGRFRRVQDDSLGRLVLHPR